MFFLFQKLFLVKFLMFEEFLSFFQFNILENKSEKVNYVVVE